MEDCLESKLGIAKPPYGYFSQLRIHETERPKPKSYATDFKNPNVGLPPDFAQEVDEKLGPKIPLPAGF